MSQLPEIKKILKNKIETGLLPSDDVLVNVEGYGIAIGRYFHTGQFWSVNGISGDVVVIEWWPLPELGTGTKYQCYFDIIPYKTKSKKREL